MPDASDLYAETHRQVDRLLLPRVLEYTGGNQHQAARLLGIARQTLRQKLRDLGLHVTHSVEADEDDQPIRQCRSDREQPFRSGVIVSHQTSSFPFSPALSDTSRAKPAQSASSRPLATVAVSRSWIKSASGIGTNPSAAASRISP